MRAIGLNANMPPLHDHERDRPHTRPKDFNCDRSKNSDIIINFATGYYQINGIQLSFLEMCRALDVFTYARESR